ncbi:MAG: endonuclease/exonuclease/phosphatase family protein [Planctomycetes bacterium]|nr:endonuclease/exonuclease/phosphatase family protein [Planctomycetota bacterium]MCB9917223.1 endonuclease/exonuclease/phosphatase family protein [Planctomycetota bacterium]
MRFTPLFGLLAVSFCLAGSPRAQSLRVACYNVENLFDNYDDPYRPDEETSPKSMAEKRILAKTIDALDADVLALCEVENRDIAMELNRMLAKPYAIVEVFASNDMRGIDCALFSRLQIRRSMSHRHWHLEGGREFARDLVVHEIAPTPGTKLLVAPMHLKSKRTVGDDVQGQAWRSAEARGVLEVLADLRALGEKSPFVLLGDLNDTPDSTSLAPLFAKMKDVTSSIAAEDRWTFEYSGQKQQIDYVLVEGHVDVRAARIVHEPDSASDHAPVVVEFTWPVEPVRIAPTAEIEAVESTSKPSARPRIDADDGTALSRNLLAEVEVVGTVRSVEPTRSGGHFNLALGDKPRSSLTLFVPRHAVARFGDLAAWKGRKLTVTGPIFRYRGRLEMQLTRKEQVAFQ